MKALAIFQLSQKGWGLGDQAGVGFIFIIYGQENGSDVFFTSAIFIRSGNNVAVSDVVPWSWCVLNFHGCSFQLPVKTIPCSLCFQTGQTTVFIPDRLGLDLFKSDSGEYRAVYVRLDQIHGFFAELVGDVLFA